MELAESSSTDAPSLYRFMRTLASLGLFTEDHEHRFSLTAMGEALRDDAPTSVRISVLGAGRADIFTKSLEQLPYSLQTGKTAFAKVFGGPFFEWLAGHPAEAHVQRHDGRLSRSGTSCHRRSLRFF